MHCQQQETSNNVGCSDVRGTEPRSRYGRSSTGVGVERSGHAHPRLPRLQRYACAVPHHLHGNGQWSGQHLISFVQARLAFWLVFWEERRKPEQSVGDTRVAQVDRVGHHGTGLRRIAEQVFLHDLFETLAVPLEKHRVEADDDLVVVCSLLRDACAPTRPVVCRE